MHRALRPGGARLDIHPEPEHSAVQIHIGAETHEIGRMDDSATIRDVHGGRAVLAALVQEGLFRLERHAVFEQVLHVSDVDTWLAYREARASRSVLDPRIVERARAMLTSAEGEIRVVDRARAAVYTAVPT